MQGKCCGSNETDVHDTVRERYAELARGAGEGEKPACCGEASPGKLAAAVGYSAAELAELPEEANMGLSCGNPTALASLAPGAVVVDLGAGGGFDIFIAARKVAPGGRAIGVDMTPEMVSRARRNAVRFQELSGLANAEFRLGEIEHLPLQDGEADVVISNCVINLSPDKARVWREIARVLKPGGRVSVSDIALLKPLPEAIKASIQALVGCIAGAATVEQTVAWATAAGLDRIEVVSKPQNIEKMTSNDDPLYRSVLELLPAGAKASDYLTSVVVTARKP